MEKINAFLCGTSSKIGDLAEFLVGEAKHCWCCAFFRGITFGTAIGIAIAATVARFTGA